MSSVVEDLHNIKRGDYVLVQREADKDWYIAEIIACIEGPRIPEDWTFFQVHNIDTGFIELISTDYVKGIVKTRNTY
ncbi:DUF3104 domain-containing protein [Prochlorococcus marinus]|uniref:DUF3104 domain-containing protein n=1 Tax=Prochlorococcus marinus TaxID=1219 RepID=UPI00059CF83B|nr:DUF3104 domain-containing protein [Prochlorococcus marinus]